MKLRFSRVQRVEVELLREPTKDERNILLGYDNETTMFDIDIIDWDSEDIIDEDYSFGIDTILYSPELRK